MRVTGNEYHHMRETRKTEIPGSECHPRRDIRERVLPYETYRRREYKPMKNTRERVQPYEKNWVESTTTGGESKGEHHYLLETRKRLLFLREAKMKEYQNCG